jgi:cytochrome b
MPDLLNRSVKIFHCWGFFGSVALVRQRDKFTSFLKQIGKNYKVSNPYHNFHHAHSVLAITANLLQTCTPGWFTDMEEFAILLASVCHDVGHRGLNSDYYIKTRHELAIQYNDISVLENMHCSLTFELLLKSSNNFTADWTEEQYLNFRKIFIQCVLATDMKQHFDLTGKLGELVSHIGGPHTLSGEEKRIIYSSIVHAADLANPTMPTQYSYDWAYRVVEEMYTQGKLEEKSGFPVAPFMKHPPSNTVEFAKLQISFMSFIVCPLWKAMAAIWPAALDERIEQLAKNNKFWEDLRDDKSRSEQ